MWSILYFDPWYISISALVLFNLLRARNYHYNKGTLKVDFVKWKMIHSGLLRTIFLQKVSLQLANNFCSFILPRDTTVEVHLILLSIELRQLYFLVMFILYSYGPLIVSQILNLYFCGIFEHNFLRQLKISINFHFNQQQQAQTLNSSYPNTVTT